MSTQFSLFVGLDGTEVVHVTHHRLNLDVLYLVKFYTALLCTRGFGGE